MKKVLKVCVVFLFCSVFFFACIKPHVHDEPKSNLIVYTNSTDPLLVSAKSDDGFVADFFGRRDANGVPAKIELIVVKKQTDTIYYYLDAMSRPNRIVTNTGVEYLLDWVTNTNVSLTAVSNDGQTQINTLVKMMLNPSGQHNNQVSRIINHSRKGRSLALGFKPGINNIQTANVTARINGTAHINITRCGFPASVNDVFVKAWARSGEYIGSFPGALVSQGKFSYTIPDAAAAVVPPGEICSKIEGILADVCSYKGPELIAALCPALSVAIASSGIGAPAAAALIAACPKIAAGLELYCATLGYDADVNVSLAQRICQAEHINRKFTDLVIRGVVHAIPNNIYGPSQIVQVIPPNTSFPDLAIELPPVTTIRSLKLTPSAPPANVDFIAETEVYCLKAGSVVTVSVVGTDGYTDEVTMTITSAQNSGTFSLSVPGADPGVRDDITVKIKLPDGTFVVRTASLVFG